MAQLENYSESNKNGFPKSVVITEKIELTTQKADAGYVCKDIIMGRVTFITDKGVRLELSLGHKELMMIVDAVKSVEPYEETLCQHGAPGPGQGCNCWNA